MPVVLTSEASLYGPLKQDFDKMTAEEIVKEGKLAGYRPDFDFEKALDTIIKKDKDGEFVFEAGDIWPKFNFEKGQKALSRQGPAGISAAIAPSGFWLYMAGQLWKKFDFHKGFESLIKLDRDGHNIVRAGESWKIFDHIRALEILKSNPEMSENYHKAMEKWPPGITMTKYKIGQMKATSKVMPKKPFGLKEAINTISKELLKMPPHYEQDGYNVILTQDLDEFNIGKFITRFRAGRVISYGQIADMKDQFSRELVFRVIEKNQIKVNDGFFFVIYEGL